MATGYFPSVNPYQPSAAYQSLLIQQQEQQRAQEEARKKQAIGALATGVAGRQIANGIGGWGSSAPALSAGTDATGVSSGMLESLAAQPSPAAPFATAGEAANAGAIPEATGMGTLGNLASAAAIAHGGYGIAQNWGDRKPKNMAMSGAEAGAGIGSFIAPGIGTAIGAGIGALAGGALGMIKAGKHDDQIARDRVRGGLQQMGFLDQNFNLDLADGTKFNVGIDGGARPEYDFSGGRRAFEVKAENPFSTQAVAWANPIAEVLTAGNPKLRSDFAGYLANGAMSNAETIEGVRANVLNYMNKLGLNSSTISGKLTELFQAGRISQDQLNAYVHGVGTLFKGDPKLYVIKPMGEAPPAQPQNSVQFGNLKPVTTVGR